LWVSLELTQEEHLKLTPHEGRLLALRTNTRLAWKMLVRDKLLSLFRTFVKYGRKKFYHIWQKLKSGKYEHWDLTKGSIS